MFANTHMGSFWGYSFSEVLVGLLILAGIVSVYVVVLRWLEIKIPQPVVYILWIIGVVFLGVFAIRLLADMW